MNKWTLALAAIAACSSAGADDSTAQVQRGSVWRYQQDGVAHYTNEPRPGDPSAEKIFDYVEVTPGEAWRVVAVDGEGIESLVHTKSAVKKGRMAYGWVLTNRPKSARAESGRSPSGSERWQVDCETQRVSVTDAVTFSGQYGTGKVLQSWSGVSAESSMMPGSVGSLLAATICLGPSKSVTLDDQSN